VRISVFVNQYPAVSHSFVRREIHALEALGYEVQRLALRHGPGLVDPRDRAEGERTTAVLGLGLGRLLRLAATRAARRPWACVRTACFAVALGRPCRIGPVRMAAYLLEAMVLCELCRGHGSRLVRVHFGSNGAVVCRLARRMGGPAFAVAYHGPEEFAEASRWDIAGTVAESAFATAISGHARDAVLREAGGALRGKVHITPCGVGRAFLRVRPLPGDGTRRLCVVARLTPRKGVGVLLDAMADAVGGGADLSLAIVGDGPLMAGLKERADRLGLRERVAFHGSLGERAVRRVMIGSHGLVLPSLSEGLPVVLMEAMGIGRPVIASRVGGVPELVEHGAHGWLVEAGDRGGLAGALVAFVRSDGATLAEMGRRGGERIRSRHDVSAAAAGLDGVIRRAVGQSGGRSRATGWAANAAAVS
jgi:glycosyltransferase involved in cell wall biosynthesis